MHSLGNRLAEGMRDEVERTKTEALVMNTGPLFGVHFTKLKRIRDIRDAYKDDDARAKALKQQMARRGVMLNPARFDSSFVSAVHSKEDVDETIEAFRRSLKETAA